MRNPLTSQTKPSSPPSKFFIDAETELGISVKAGKLLEEIVEAKKNINYIRKKILAQIAWVVRNATTATTYRWLLDEMQNAMIDTNSIVYESILPYIHPAKITKKAIAVWAYVQIYTDAINENLMLLDALEKKHYIQQKTLIFQRVLYNNAQFFAAAEFLNGISPEPEYIRFTKDKVYVLPMPMAGRGGGIDLNKAAENL